MNIPIESIPKYKGKEVTHSDMADNIDIRRAIFSAVPEANNQTKKLAKYFGRNSSRETCKAIFDFLKTKLNYVADGDTQLIKLPSALLHSKVGDCKSYSLLTSAILTNLGIPHHFVLVSYNNDPTPSHIYVETEDGCIIDAVWGIFDDEKRPTYRYEVKTNGQMKVKSISGIGNYGLCRGGNCGCSSCSSTKVGYIGASSCNTGIGAAETAVEWAERNGVWKSFSVAKRYLIRTNIVQPILVTARTVVRLIVSQNAGGIANALKKLQTESDGSKKDTFKQSSWDSMRSIEMEWLEKGGNPNELYDAIAKGANKDPKGKKFGELLVKASKGEKPNVKDWVVGAISALFGKRYTGAVNGIRISGAGGETPVILSATFWTPIITKMMYAVGASITLAVTNKLFPSADEEQQQDEDGGGGADEPKDDEGKKSSTTTYLLLGGAAIAAYFLLKKK
jgi:hypothetical protein